MEFEETAKPIRGWGVDRDPDRRPGVPMQTEPRRDAGAHWERPPRQRSDHPVLTRAELSEPTPVFGTAQPPHGLSGLFRRLAYRIPEHHAAHWAWLMFADRVDVVESAVTDAFRRRPVVFSGIGTVALIGLLAGVGSRRRVRRPRRIPA